MANVRFPPCSACWAGIRGRARLWWTSPPYYAHRGIVFSSFSLPTVGKSPPTSWSPADVVRGCSGLTPRFPRNGGSPWFIARLEYSWQAWYFRLGWGCPFDADTCRSRCLPRDSRCWRSGVLRRWGRSWVVRCGRRVLRSRWGWFWRGCWSRPRGWWWPSWWSRSVLPRCCLQSSRGVLIPRFLAALVLHWWAGPTRSPLLLVLAGWGWS